MSWWWWMDGVAATTRSDQTRYDTTQLETTVTVLIRDELPIGRQVPTAEAREEPWSTGDEPIAGPPACCVWGIHDLKIGGATQLNSGVENMRTLPVQALEGRQGWCFYMAQPRCRYCAAAVAVFLTSRASSTTTLLQNREGRTPGWQRVIVGVWGDGDWEWARWGMRPVPRWTSKTP